MRCIIGDVNDAIAVVTGYDIIWGEHISRSERGLYAAALFAGSGVAGAMLTRGDDVADILRGHVRAGEARFAREGFTRAQSDAIAKNPRLAPMFRGERIHTFMRQSAIGDERLPAMGVNIFRPGRSSPDFYRTPTTDGWWDLTTAGQWDRHQTRYGPGGIWLPY